MSLSITVNEVVARSNSLLLAKHETWSRVPLGAIANVLNGFAFSSELFGQEKGTPLIRIRDILSNETDCLYNGEFDSTYLVNNGDLLIGMDGDFNCSLWKGPLGLLNQRVCKVEVKKRFFDLKFLFYLLPGYLSEINRATSSVTVKHLSSKSVEEIPLPLPPFLEQQRIVEAIEQQFSRLDEGVALLRQAQRKLKLYRTSVLKAAVEGELTVEWRESHADVEPASELLKRILAERRAKWEEEQIAKGRDLQKVKYVEPAEPDVSRLPELPEKNWCRATMEQVGDIIGGVTKGRDLKEREIIELPYLRVANVQRGYIDTTIMKTIQVPLDEVRRYLLEKGDIVLTEGGDPDKLGRAAIWEGQIENCIHQNHIFRVRIITGDVSSQWLSYYTNSEHGKTYFLNAGKQTVNLASINLTQLKSFPLSIPPLAEQEQIALLVEERLSIIDELERTIEKALKQAERQRQSILQRAFTGKLVAQDPNDEPASVLLERIKRKREEQVGQRERRKVKSTQSKKSVTGPARAVRVLEEEAEPLDVTGLKQESLWQEEMEEPEEVEAQGVSWRNLEA